MKISTQFPPNYDLIRFAFPDCEKYRATFCYGDTIYNPFAVNILPDVEHHESIHSKQQGDRPDIWWNKYITDPQFRLEQEIEAYGEQYAFAKTLVKRVKMIDWLKGRLAMSLSGGLYGNLISYGEAEAKIRNYEK